MPTKPISNAPSFSAKVWLDKVQNVEGLYVELACGLITRFEFTEGGLTKVLKLLRKERPTIVAKSNGVSKPTLPMAAKKVTRGKLTTATTEEADKALDFLKKRGLV
jgi:hypothetical protein